LEARILADAIVLAGGRVHAQLHAAFVHPDDQMAVRHAPHRLELRREHHQHRVLAAEIDLIEARLPADPRWGRGQTRLLRTPDTPAYFPNGRLHLGGRLLLVGDLD